MAYRDFLDNLCPDDTAIGMVTIGVVEGRVMIACCGEYLEQVQTTTNAFIIWNRLVVSRWSWVCGSRKLHPVLLDGSVRTGGDYGVTVTSRVSGGCSGEGREGDDLGCAGGSRP